jgi:hypothetical protein
VAVSHRCPPTPRSPAPSRSPQHLGHPGRRGWSRSGASSCGAVRFTIPVSTELAPSSTTSVTPMAARVCTVSRQRTGALSWWASSSGQSSRSACAGGVDVGDDRRVRVGEWRPGQDLAEGHGRRDERAVIAQPRRRGRRCAPRSVAALCAAGSAPPRPRRRPPDPGRCRSRRARPRPGRQRPHARRRSPMHATIPPGACSAARRVSSARASTSRSPSAKVSTPAASSALYSPSEWPATTIGRPPPLLRQASRSTAWCTYSATWQASGSRSSAAPARWPSRSTSQRSTLPAASPVPVRGMAARPGHPFDAGCPGPGTRARWRSSALPCSLSHRRFTPVIGH